MGYNSACVKDVRDFCVYRWGFRDGPLNAASHISPQSIPVAMATKFGTKLAITWLMKEISARSLCLYGVFQEWASECCQSNFKPTDPRCSGNKIGTKWAI